MTLAPEAPSAAHLDYSDYPAVAPLFHRFVAMAHDDPQRAALREQLIVLHLPLAEHLAMRFARRGEPLDDLEQVARVGLLKAIDRFDPRRGIAFLSYAVPTVGGEIRRHFRDHAWYVRPPRRLQDLHLQINAATSELFQRDQRAPTAAVLAEHLGLSPDEVHEALQLANSYSPMPLDTPVRDEPDGPSLADSIGADDDALSRVDDHEALKRLLAELTERERRILGMRFFDEWTQSQIAVDIGVSQMQVSRLLSATLTRLRRRLLTEG